LNASAKSRLGFAELLRELFYEKRDQRVDIRFRSRNGGTSIWKIKPVIQI